MDDPRYAQMVRAAELYYERYLSQREIAKILGNSISTVSRLLAEARTSGIVEITIHRQIDKVPEISERLRKEFGLRDVVVVSGSSIPEGSNIMEVAEDPNHGNKLRVVGAAAAELLLSIIENDMTIGISWGLPPYSLVQALADTSMEGVKVVQMLGSLGEGDPAVDGPEIALRLAERLNASYRYVHAPAVVESKELCQMLLQQPQIHETLERASQSNITITGIGAVADDNSSLERAGYLTKEERLAYLERGAVGHIMAKMFDIDGNEIDSYNERVVAMSFDNLRQAEWSICICEAARKAEAVLGALRGRYFNTLVITDEAARKVLDLANQDSA